MEKLKISFVILFIYIGLSLGNSDYPKCHKSNLQWFPHLTNCSLYYICHHGNTIERSCAPGLHFNNSTGQCMLPELASCSLFCPAKDDPKNVLFLPDFNDCSKYFICYNGEAIHRSCAEGLLFDMENNWCNFYGNVDCGHRGGGDEILPPGTLPPDETTTHTTTTTTTTTTEPTTTTPRDSGHGITYYNCPLEIGPFFFPHEFRCDKYFRCYSGISYLMDCASGTEYDQFEHICKRDANCYSRNPTTSTTMSSPF
ncbi:hypothetical protein PVAND_002369 [Polypedilum vanderplanki]|uniref:Chitin-binding type-2 domain-containing protein n=1 Tax=Polypedilum vanderplanki TaxID=319348 RepID=A0A9J6BRY9_POLVA|nr:hypothetical protein PVAND_002369 [Polypedilum vanderplanki]